jgi:NADH:ubiquinone oxidoreductase subunit E
MNLTSNTMEKKVIKVCTGGACSQNLSSYTFKRAENDIEFLKLQDKAEVQECPCQGNCEFGPTVIVEDKEGDHKNKQQFSRVNPLEMGKIMRKIKNNNLSQNQPKKHTPKKK